MPETLSRQIKGEFPRLIFSYYNFKMDKPLYSITTSDIVFVNHISIVARTVIESPRRCRITFSPQNTLFLFSLHIFGHLNSESSAAVRAIRPAIPFYVS
jgi:hypothetical protein